ncbi:MAG: GlgB N-terminal domain-containing protein, partial [Rudaea sp.]
MSDAGWQASQVDIDAILAARHADPFAVLGPHATRSGVAIRAFVPHADTLSAIGPGAVIVPLEVRGHGFFEGLIGDPRKLPSYHLRAANAGGEWEFDDPYTFAPVLGATDDHLLVEGTHRKLYERLGAQLLTHQGAAGVHFAVWAPNAQRVSVVGDFNRWDGRTHQMRKRIDSGLWEIFAPGLGAGTVYKFEIVGAGGSLLPLKADPFGFGAELRPSTASVVTRADDFVWNDADYLRRRAGADARREPMSTYEVHLGSWRRRDDGGFLSYDELAAQLLPYVADLGFTHIELLPISEHPLDASWGYQPIGLFAPTARFADSNGAAAAGFARFVDAAHALGIGVILDWVPA